MQKENSNSRRIKTSKLPDARVFEPNFVQGWPFASGPTEIAKKGNMIIKVGLIIGVIAMAYAAFK